MLIKIENVQVAGFEPAIRGMRNPMNSWDLSDSKDGKIGESDLRLMKTLSKAGDDHSKYLRMIVVWMDITAPMYWWKEFDTYKVGTVANSCSTMHKLTSRPLTLDDFSFGPVSESSAQPLIDDLNNMIEGLKEYQNKDVWYSLIERLPMCYNQKRTVMVNYAVLKKMYHARKDHKLWEWQDFCDRLLIDDLFPYFTELAVNPVEGK